jgi:hypothetical protein
MAFVTTAAVIGAVAAVGGAYAQHKAAKNQQKMANIQNMRERKQQLRAIRMAQRATEFAGSSSGTSGSSAQAQAMGSAASTGAGNIGYQSAMIANANQVSHWNNVASGFGALKEVGAAIGNANTYLGKQKGAG